MGTKTYDPECLKLAKHFLEGDEENIAFSGPRCQEDLAKEIQFAIEDWIEQKRNERDEPPDPPGFEGGFADNH